MRYERLDIRDLRNAPDARIARLAGRQHGIVSLNQLHVAGLDKHAIARRVRSGRLHRVGRGVYAVGHTALSREAEFLVAVLTAGRDAALSHLACAELCEVWRWRASLIDVVVPAQRRVMSQARIHRTTLHPDDVTVHKGIPCTTIARLVVDLTDHLTSWEITNVIHEAEWLDLFDLDATYAAIERGNGRRIAAARKAVALHLDGSAGARSKNELKVLIDLERRKLPEPKCQHGPQRLRGRLPLARAEIGHRARRTRPRSRHGRSKRTRSKNAPGEPQAMSSSASITPTPSHASLSCAPADLSRRVRRFSRNANLPDYSDFILVKVK